MRSKLIWGLILIIGIIFVGFATLIIGDIDLKARNEDVTNSAVYVNCEPNVDVVSGKQTYINILEIKPTMKYLELKFENLDDSIDVTLYDNLSSSELFTVKVDNGRNFIAINDYYRSIQLQLASDEAFKILNIRFSEHMPLRTRHVAAFSLFLLVWLAFIGFAARKRNISFAQVLTLKKYTYLLINLVKMDFTKKYRRSVLGILWSVLNPLLMAVVITTVFSRIFRVQVENFGVYYLTGSLIFNFMIEATTGALNSVVESSGLIKKVYIPKYIFPVEKCFFALVNTAFSFIALLILAPILGVPLNPTVLLFWVPLTYVLIFSIGFGMILSAANTFFRDIGHLYGVISLVWMYLTPVIYPAEAAPRALLPIFIFNPMYYYVNYFRNIMMYNTLPDLRQNTICFTFAIAFFLAGLVMFKLKQDRFILYI